MTDLGISGKIELAKEKFRELSVNRYTCLKHKPAQFTEDSRIERSDFGFANSILFTQGSRFKVSGPNYRNVDREWTFVVNLQRSRYKAIGLHNNKIWLLIRSMAVQHTDFNVLFGAWQ